MSVTYTDQIRPAAARVDSDAYVPVYARSGARKSNKSVKTWMILAPLGVLVVGGAAAAMLMPPAEPTAAEAVPFAPLAAQLAASEVAPLNAPTIPVETPAELTTAAPIPPAVAAPVERRAEPATPTRAARAAPRVAPAAESAEAPIVSTGPQPYQSAAPQTVEPAAAPVTAPAPAAMTASPAPIVITPPT